MALKSAAGKKGGKTGRSKSPFGQPSDDEVFEILIPEGAESGKIPASDAYIGKVINVERGEGKDSGNPMLTWTLEMATGPYKGMHFRMWTTLTANSMWKMADVMTALGIEWKAGQPVRIK